MPPISTHLLWVKATSLLIIYDAATCSFVLGKYMVLRKVAKGRGCIALIVD